MSVASSAQPYDLFIKDKGYEPASRDPSQYNVAGEGTALIIDNGSGNLRAGFANHSQPYINEPSLVARYRTKTGVPHLLFGRDVEVEAASRANVRPIWEGDLLLNADGLEAGLDYTLLQLTALSDPMRSGQGQVPHPVVMTERLGSPLHSRTVTSELLFEGYGVPSVAYGVDGLFAFEGYCNRKAGGVDFKGKSAAEGKDGMVISMGHWSTSVIPILDGKGVMHRAKRIPWGGANASELMLKLAQLKYPNFPTRVTPNQATLMYHDTAYFSLDYPSELKSLAQPENMAKQGKVVQYEYALPEVVQKTEEELAIVAERRREQGKRLQEQAAAKRAENAAQREANLAALRGLRGKKPSMDEEDYLNELVDEGFDSEAELDKAIKLIEGAMKRSKKDAGESEDEDEQTFPMIDVPDDELDEEGIKEKRKQKLMKAGYDARMRMKAEKQAEKARIAEEKRKDEESRLADPIAWAARLRQDHENTLLRMRERKKKRQALSNRKTATAQARMKTITSLAQDTPVSKRRKKGNDDDTFGADDDDWAVYREIDGGEDSDAEADDQDHLKDLEAALLEHDPTFDESHTLAAQLERKSALITAFLRSDQKFDPDDIAQSHQLHLNVERIRVPETWFQPSIAGVDSAGIAEVAGWLLNGFTPEERKRMMQRIYVTGASAAIPNLKDRLHSELMALLPSGEPLQIVADWPDDSKIAAWKGMAAWSKTDEAVTSAITRAEWQEMGGAYLKEHRWSNWADA